MLARIKDYFRLMRWHRPIPILLSLWPTYWGLFLAKVPSLKLVIVFTVGVMLMRSAGSVVNDIYDQQYDRFVERTRNRPLAARRVSNFEAVGLLGLLLLGALSLLWFLNPLVQILAIPAVILALTYPLAKRFTYFPQFVLGLAFNFGMIMAYAAVNGCLGGLLPFFYVLSIIWTLFYDTIYSLMDYTDDKRLGVKSPATYFDGRVYLFLFSMVILLMVGVSIMMHKLHVLYSFLFWMVFLIFLVRAWWSVVKPKILFLLPFMLLSFQMRGMKLPIWNNPMLCPSLAEQKINQKVFDQQQWFGFLVFLVILGHVFMVL